MEPITGICKRLTAAGRLGSAFYIQTEKKLSVCVFPLSETESPLVCQDFFTVASARPTPPLSEAFRSGRGLLWALCRWMRKSTSCCTARTLNARSAAHSTVRGCSACRVCERTFKKSRLEVVSELLRAGLDAVSELLRAGSRLRQEQAALKP